MNTRDRSTEEASAEGSFIKGLGLNGFSSSCSCPTIIDTRYGKIIRMRPLRYDLHYKPEQFNPWKIDARGQVFEPDMKVLLPPLFLAYKKRIYSPNRILYPMKRVDWDPNGKRNTENRGKSKFVRISWDEAVDLIVSEIKRIKDTYGMEGILSQSEGHGETQFIHATHGCANKLLALLGGYTVQIRNMDSWEGWHLGAKHVWGTDTPGHGEMVPDTNTIPDIARNSEMLLFWGCDPETTPWCFNGQISSKLCYWFTQLGIKCVYICPDLNYGAAIHADKWIPIKPNTDAALQLAIAYTWITEGTYDKEFIATHTYGYENFEEYVLGKEDGEPKTPEWASEKCEVPVETIKALAREWASKRTSIMHGNGGPGIRSAYASEQGRLEPLLLAMQGLGKPGVHQGKMIEYGVSGLMNEFGGYKGGPLPKSIKSSFSMLGMHNDYIIIDIKSERAEKSIDGAGFNEIEKRMTPAPINPTQFIQKNLIHDAILNPPVSWYGNSTFLGTQTDQFNKYTYPAEGCSEVHMIWTDTPCWITCWNDSNTYIKALRSPKIEFMLAMHPWLENDCLFADIVLPVCSKFEREDIVTDSSDQYYSIIYEGKCAGIGESKSSYEIVSMIAEKFGLLEKYTGGFTEEELRKINFEHHDVQDMISYDELKEKGYFVIPTDPDWDKIPAGLSEFRRDLENNPLQTPSGKIEFYSLGLAKHFPDDTERPPVPHWIEKGESHDERTSSERAHKYPLLIITNHGRWRMHAQCDDISWTREAPTCKILGADGYKYEPVWINPADAAKRGIRHHDVVKVYNERGIVLGGAYVTERMMPGVVYMDHGARYDPVVPGEIDRGGAINTITPHNSTSKNANGMVVSSFLVEVEKADLDELRTNYPDAFKRKYHPASGLRFEAWVEET
jgi:anaerobic selenocysteine-containing dehydrogenase